MMDAQGDGEIPLVSTEEAMAEVRRWLEVEKIDPERIFTAMGDQVVRYRDLVAHLEREIVQALNHTGFGPMGFGGSSYALAAHMELIGTHTAVMPLAIIFQCWAHRYSRARVYDDGRVEYLTHPEEEKRG